MSNIEVKNIKAIRKGSLLASCDVAIIPWSLTLKDVKVFEKGRARWVGMPSRESVSSDGSKVYIELIEFHGEGPKNRFKAQIMGAIDRCLAENPGMEPPDVITNDDLPF